MFAKKTKRFLNTVVVLLFVFSLFPFAATATPIKASPDAVSFTILHTNDFHGQLEPAGSNPGASRVATVINNVRSAVGSSNVLLLDAGDEMQGSLLSNLQKGAPTIDVFNNMGYQVATLGNHEFDWGQTVLISRTNEATYPFIAANIVVSDTGSCATAGWTVPSFISAPYITQTVGVTDTVTVGIIGVSTIETPYITIAEATEGLCFKDPAESILHYYDELAAVSDVLVVLSHLGYTDGGYGYGLSVYGDQTLAGLLNDAGKPVDLIIGGHSHTNLAAATVVDDTTIVQAYYNGRRVGRADITVDSGDVSINWAPLTVAITETQDATIQGIIDGYTSDPEYQAQINQVIGYTDVPIVRNYNGDSLMGYFVNDAIYNELNNDATTDNDVDMVFNNPGGLRADIVGASYPYTLTYGALYNVLPFGNQTIVGDMTGVQIMDLLNQSATLFKGALQPSGIEYSFFSYTDTLPGPQPYAWGAYDVCVWSKTNPGSCEELDLEATYRVGTNEFLAPAGQDGFVPFKYMTNISYWGDMLNQVINWVSVNYPISNPYNDALDGRITRNGNASGGTIVPLTILHHADSHGNLAKGTYVGYTQLATLIKQERLHNPNRTLLLNAGDQIQGDAMMYYFKSAPLGYTADGSTLSAPLTYHPMMAVMNHLQYDAMTIGNHEYNFGKEIFTSVLAQANFPIMQANVEDDGSYGLDDIPVQPYIKRNVGPEGIKVAILGIGNHRIPNYELPSNIPGLTFTNPITVAQELSDNLRATNDVLIALTHIGFTTNPTSVEVDENVDTEMAAQVSGLDAILGGHSHTDPSKQTAYSGDYKYLPTIVGGPDNMPVLINHAYRYNNTLGEVIIGLRANNGRYDVVSRAGRYISVSLSDTEDATVKAIVDPYTARLANYTATVIGQTTKPIDALTAYTEETNAANLQADASVAELADHGITVDFHLSGAMSNRKVADTATPSTPYTLTVGNMFTLMPYENSLVVISMNGPQLKAVLERAYRNYYYYKYVPGYGGYSYYTTCMLDINSGGTITYNDVYPAAYDSHGNHVVSLEFDGHEVDFLDSSTYYDVSTVNYLAAGSCNFNDDGVSLWPLDQIVHDTQYYVRDAVINYITDQGVISPEIEGRLQFLTGVDMPEFMRLPLIIWQ